ncbi:unnamed protein product [Paramecium sonneborni]|uniref:Uncharacterized protein n=1 Tax=Paramecium sonneborni TaxID=65129 RepID=A0A8S1RN99_9CILI|nr:unnamed protein product [Paramecium sonneborni]
MRPSSASGSLSREQDKINKEQNKPTNPYKLPIGIKQNKQNSQKMDWEKLYEESQQLKMIVNQFKDENTKLKTKNINLEKDLVKCSNIIEEMEQTGNVKRFYQTPMQDNQMILNLKTQVKQLNEQLNDSKLELQNIKKASKYTKLSELEIECKQFQDETIRLSQIIEQLITDNIYQKQFENDQNKLKEMLIQREQLIKQMQEQLEYYIDENKVLSEKLEQMVQAYQELDKIYNKYQNEAKNKLKIKDKQIQDLKNDIDRISLNTKSQKQIAIKKANPQKLMDKSLNISTKRDQSFKINNNTNNSNSSNNILSSCINRQIMDLIDEPVKEQELQEIKLEVRLRLSSANIPTVKLDRYLFNQNTSQIDFCSLHDRLTKQPFLLDKPDAMLFARYLIEKHNQQYPYNININLTQQHEFVKSEFINITGYWPIYDKLESKIIEIYLSKLFSNIISLLESKLIGQNFRYLDLFAILDLFLKQQKKLSLKQIEYQYLLLKIIKDCQNIRKLNGSLIFKYLKELCDSIDNDNQNALDELQKYYTGSSKRNSFFFKQLRLKQEQILSLCELDQKVYDPQLEQQIDKSSKTYLQKNGLIRSYSEPNFYELQLHQEDDHDNNQGYQNNQEDEELLYQQAFNKQMKDKQQSQEDYENQNNKFYVDDNDIDDDDYQLEQTSQDQNEEYSESQLKYQIKNKTNKSENYEQDDFENELEN